MTVSIYIILKLTPDYNFRRLTAHIYQTFYNYNVCVYWGYYFTTGISYRKIKDLASNTGE
jgi:hypothetical protein